MKLLITFVLIITFSKNYSQTNNIKYVHFHSSNSSVIDSGIDIAIYHLEDNSVDVYVETFNSKKKYKTTSEKFLELSSAIIKINPKDVIHDEKNCLDGNDTEINFASRYTLPENIVKYSISCLGSEDKNTAWKDYLIAVNLILNIAKLELKDLK